MNDTRYFTKQLLIEYNNAAIREKRNRAIKEEVLESLQDGQVFPITFDMYHSKREMRVMISLFKIGTAFLDMTEERYYMLPIAKWNKKTQTYIFEDEEEVRKKFPYKNREWTEKVVKKPYRKQGKFRKEIFKAYNGTCAVCGIKEPKILRAAHIIPVAEGGSDEIQNGLCLCTNHEIAFDKGLLKIKADGTIESQSEEFKGIYDNILYPKNKEWYPSSKYLKIKYENSFKSK